MQARAKWMTGLVMLLLCAGGAIALVLSSPKVVLLWPARGAEWIRHAEPFDLLTRYNEGTECHFRCEYTGSVGLSGASVGLMALGRATVWVDGGRIFDTGPNISNWKIERQVPINVAGLLPGRHTLDVIVSNPNGPSMIRADCPALGIRTGRGWQCSVDEHSWSAAALATDNWEPALAGQFETTGSDLRRLWGLCWGCLWLGPVDRFSLSGRTWGRGVRAGRWLR